MSGITTGAARSGDIRVTPNGTVEMYDGDAWVPYERVLDVTPDPLIRGGKPVRTGAGRHGGGNRIGGNGEGS